MTAWEQKHRFATVACLSFLVCVLFAAGLFGGPAAAPSSEGDHPHEVRADVGYGPDRVTVSRAPARAVELPRDVLRLKADTVIPLPGLSPRLQERLSLEQVGPTYVIVQFHDVLTETLRSDLEALSVEVIEYIPQLAFVCSVDLARLAELVSLDEVRAVVAIKPEWKIAPTLRQQMAAQPQELVELWIRAFAPIDELLPEASYLEEGLYEATLDHNGMMRLAQDGRVKWIERRRVEQLLLAESVPLVGADDVWYARTGQGVGVAVIDTGIDPLHLGEGGHFEHADIVLGYDWVDGDWMPWDEHGHGTHCAGTIAGQNVPGGHPLVGTSPMATLVVERVFDAGGNWHGGSYADIFGGVVSLGASILNNSWGADNYGKYDARARNADIWAYDNPHHLLVFANGNSPNSTYVNSPALAKNVIAVGALHDGSLPRATPPTVNHTSAGLADTSSTINNLLGPEDGRIKPDIMTPGVNIAAPVVGGWGVMSGTSMAAPHVSGLAALFRETYPTRPAPVIKAALVATAIDLEDKPGQTPHPIGWGKTPSAVDMLWKNPWEHDQFYFHGEVGHKEDAIHTFQVPAGTERVIVSLVWWDPPGSELADPAQVNALDLFIGPSGTPYEYASIQWVDTVGRAVIDNPDPSGDWSITVHGYNIPGGGTQRYYGYCKVLEYATPSWDATVTLNAPHGPEEALSYRYDDQSLPSESPEQVTITVPVGVPFGFHKSWEVTRFYVAGAYWTIEPTTTKLQLVSGDTGYIVGEHHQGELWQATTEFVATEEGTYPNAIRLTLGSTNTPTWQADVDVVAYELPTYFQVRRETGDVLTPGRFYGSDFRTGGADLAEWVPVSEPVEPGHVLEIDPESVGRYRLAQGPCTASVAGVVSTQPGLILRDSAVPNDGQALLALLGIVPVKVTNAGGSIAIGDLLVVSSTPGYAMRWDPDSGSVCGLVGKALEPWDEGSGMIEALLAR